MDEEDEGGLGDFSREASRCAVCGRPVEIAPRGTRGAPGLGAGGIVDNRPLCKSCQAGRYRAKGPDRRGRR